MPCRQQRIQLPIIVQFFVIGESDLLDTSNLTKLDACDSLSIAILRNYLQGGRVKRGSIFVPAYVLSDQYLVDLDSAKLRESPSIESLGPILTSPPAESSEPIEPLADDERGTSIQAKSEFK